MASSGEPQGPWLIAAWPGMGSVAIGANAYLVDKLQAGLVHEIQAGDAFDIQHVEIKQGIARAGRMPRSMFFEFAAPNAQRDLLIFIAEAQPSNGGLAYCHQLLDYAMQRGVERVYTFAAMATQLHPSDDPRVFGVATDRDLLQQLQELEVEVLDEGQISGLNGVLLVAAHERGVPAACLMGELPYFAAGVPNPKASMAALEVFSTLTGIEIDFTDLERQSKGIEKGLLELMEKMRDEARDNDEGFSIPEYSADESAEEEKTPPALDFTTRNRIEAMFEGARQDRAKAFKLKKELDRLGVFSEYEDRFLDLFKQAE